MRTSSRAADLDIVEGTLPLGLPYRALGSGPPLVFLRWFTPDHANPAGLMARAEIAALAPLAAHRRVYAVNRAPDMPSGTTMAEIADDHAAALRTEFSAPVDVLGISSGGSVALQLAADHPDVVRRLVVAASASRLEERARVAQLRYAEAAAAGKRALHHMEPEPRTVRARINAAVMWLLDPLARPRNPADTLAFVRAEDAFDVTDRLAADRRAHAGDRWRARRVLLAGGVPPDRRRHPRLPAGDRARRGPHGRGAASAVRGRGTRLPRPLRDRTTEGSDH
ncbi:alpha/beta fold hydrolase [Nocardia farcinica]|uniref:alpha/beta fold hydrolase n=1 Tax=Nocardia farcinica TaxID=37329 RepID=UPI003CC7E31D